MLKPVKEFKLMQIDLYVSLFQKWPMLNNIFWKPNVKSKNYQNYGESHTKRLIRWPFTVISYLQWYSGSGSFELQSYELTENEK